MALLRWAAQEVDEIDDFDGFTGCDSDISEQISYQIFSRLVDVLEGEPLQKLHTCDFNGAEAWRLLTKKYAPTTALRGMQLMLSVVNAPKAKTHKDVSKCIDIWETRVQQLSRDFGEQLSPKMKAAILVSMLPTELQDAVVQNAERYDNYDVAKEKIVSIAEAKAMMSKDPDKMDCSYYDYGDHNGHPDHDGGDFDEKDAMALGQGGDARTCYLCGGKGHVAAVCPTPAQPKGGGKGKGKDGGKAGGKGKGKAGSKGGFQGFCSYCGRKGHKYADCWDRQKAEGEKPGSTMACLDEGIGEVQGVEHEIQGFEIGEVEVANPSVDEQCGWTTVTYKKPKKSNGIAKSCPTASSCASSSCASGRASSTSNSVAPIRPVEGVCARSRSLGNSRWNRVARADHDFALDVNALESGLQRGKITIDSGAAESVMPEGMLQGVKLEESEGSRRGVHYITANGGKMPNLGEKKVFFRTRDGGTSSVIFQVTHARKPLASVSRIVSKGNRVVFGSDESYIENVETGRRVPITFENGTYHMDVDFFTGPARDFPRQT